MESFPAQVSQHPPEPSLSTSPADSAPSPPPVDGDELQGDTERSPPVQKRVSRIRVPLAVAVPNGVNASKGKPGMSDLEARYHESSLCYPLHVQRLPHRCRSTYWSECSRTQVRVRSLQMVLTMVTPTDTQSSQLDLHHSQMRQVQRGGRRQATRNPLRNGESNTRVSHI